MGIVQLLKPGLFFYECIRAFILTFRLTQPDHPAGLPGLIYAAPGVLFPLMAFFIWIDTSRYRVYLPLYTAGKCVGIFVLSVWLIVTYNRFIPVTTELLYLSGDLFAIAIIIFIMKDENNINAEENECE